MKSSVVGTSPHLLASSKLFMKPCQDGHPPNFMAPLKVKSIYKRTRIFIWDFSIPDKKSTDASNFFSQSEIIK
jgi:hypothetical protein